MNLHVPLELKTAETSEVRLVPTKAFFKPVLLIGSHLTKDDATIIGAHWVFDANGNPHNFDGSVKIAGDLAKAEVLIAGVQYITEAITGFVVSRDDKGRARLTFKIQFRDEEPVAPLLEYLASINQNPFPVTVKDRQLSLVGSVVGREDPEWKPAEPDENGNFDHRRGTIRPFSHKLLSAAIIYIETAEGFRSGWSMISKFKESWEGGRVISTSSRAYASENEACEAGGRLIWENIEQLKPGGKAEAKAIEMLRAYLVDISPAIAMPAIDLDDLAKLDPDPPDEGGNL